ncbi:MAG: AMP-binding protein [Methylococcales bacterium]|nr:AMP-binding protein [Methylococcales bacterium]
MSEKLTPLSHYLISEKTPTSPVSYHAGQYFQADEFCQAVKAWVVQLQQQPVQRFALFTEDAYPFAVLLFALLHAGKEVWIPGNNRPGTALQLSQLNCQLIGDWDANRPFDFLLAASASSALDLSPLDPENTKLVMFTSGSTGHAKPIVKHLFQFQLEIETLEKLWGKQLKSAASLATVSHQHIYGLLFRVLWPLSAGRCFHSPCYINPETLALSAQNIASYWVASPAHLKRLDQGSPWDEIANLCVIFSSGGPLPNGVARQIYNCCGQPVIEVYGSTETGGIGWKLSGYGPPTDWTLFDGLSLKQTHDGWLLQSTYLQSPQSLTSSTYFPEDGLQLDDQISLQSDGRFTLHGRLDRIVKIEEKRLSLSELEHRLLALPWITETFSLKLTKNREVIGVAIILSKDGLQSLKTKGRKALIKQLRNELHHYFDAVLLPRKWLFLEQMPQTSEGKIEQLILYQLLNLDSRKYPHVLKVEKTADGLELNLNVPEELMYFPGHFPRHPILPGVVQIAWAEHFCKLFFSQDKPILTLEVIKFVQVITPGLELKLRLNWKPSPGKLYFNFSSERGAHSSGRLVVT